MKSLRLSVGFLGLLAAILVVGSSWANVAVSPGTEGPQAQKPGTAIVEVHDPSQGVVTDSTGGKAAESPYAPGQFIVKYRDSVTEPVHRLLERGQLFRSATTDGSDSLDRLHQKFGIRSARPLFRTPSEDAALSPFAAQLDAKRFHADKIKRVKQRFTERTKRIPHGIQAPDLSHIYVVNLPEGSDVAAAVRAFNEDPHVAYAQPNYRATLQFVPNDDYYASASSWGQPDDDLWGLKLIQMESAWDITRGAGTVVAVVDTGLDDGHREIKDNIWLNPNETVNGLDDDANGYIDDTWGWDFANADNDPVDDNGHGTHVSGTIAAAGDNRKGIVGIAFESRIMPLKGFGSGGSGAIDNLAAAIVYAAENGADVINNSWACSTPCPSNPVAEDAVRVAHALGTVVVFSAGNAGDDVAEYSPQNIGETVVVAASTPSDAPTFFTNFGVGLDVTAPGGGENVPPPAFDPFRNILSLKSDICSTVICPPELVVDRDYLRQAGTSMSGPHVAGVAALVVAAHPEFLNEQVRQAIRKGSDDVGPAGFDEFSGEGRLNAAGALAETPLAVLITQPVSGEVITGGGLVNVFGIAEGPDFANWTLDYGIGTSPSAWLPIASSTTPVSGGFLAAWDTASLAEGSATLRLTGQKATGATYTDYRAVINDNVILTDPDPNRISGFRGGDVITIAGTAFPADFSHYTIRVQASDGTWLSDPGITLTGGGLQPVLDGVLGTWDTTGEPADHYTIELEVTRTGGAVVSETAPVLVDPDFHAGWPQDLGQLGSLSLLEHLTAEDVDGDGSMELVVGYGDTVRIFHHTGVQLAGWPQTIDPTGEGRIVQTGPAVGDLNGDGSPEIVATNNYGWLFVWEADGTPLPGWPKQFGSLPHAPTIDDIDGDGGNEIIATSWDSKIRVIDLAGNDLPGWPVTLSVSALPSPASIGDVDGDGQKEIAVVETGNTRELYLLETDGTVLPGWPKPINPGYPPTWTFIAYPALGDLDGDGDLEVVLGAGDGTVYGFHHDGTDVAGWPQTTQGEMVNSPAIGDIDGDGLPEVVAGTGRLVSGDEFIYAWSGDGVLLPGWPVPYDLPITHGGFGFGAPALADIDSDGYADVVVSSDAEGANPFALNAYRYDGTKVAGFPKATFSVGANRTNTAALADLDGDGAMELAWIDSKKNLTVWDLTAPATGGAPWPMFHHDARHTGTNPGGSGPVSNFDVAVAPATQSTTRGVSALYTVTVSSLAGYAGTVTLSMTPSDPSITGSFNPNPVVVPADGFVTSTLTVDAGPVTPGGSYNLTIEGTDGVKTHTDDVELVVESTDIDLTTTDVTGPAQAALGTYVNVTATVLNEGIDPSGLFWSSLYIADDPQGAGWSQFLDQRIAPSLSGGESQGLAFTNLLLPGNIEPGTYYLRLYADYLGWIAESDETNNSGSTPIQIVAPDLVMTDVTGPPTAEAGASIDVSYTVQNQGPGQTPDSPGAFSVGIYLSVDGTITTGDTYLGSHGVTVLQPDEIRSGQVSVQVPGGQQPGTYYLGAIADYTDSITETVETNNALTVQTIEITPLSQAADLVVLDVGGPKNGRIGQSITITTTIQNQGDAATGGSFDLGIYFSTDATITTGDIHGTSVLVGPMAVGESRAFNIDVLLDASIAPGTYYPGAIADEGDVIVESDENNNALAGETIRIK